MCQLFKKYYDNCLDNVNSTMIPSLEECVNQCNTVTFSPGISSSKLEDMEGFNLDDKVLEEFNTGLETRCRVDDENMANFLNELTAVRSLQQ